MQSDPFQSGQPTPVELPGFPGSPMTPPPRKGRGGIIAIIAIILIVLIGGGVTATVILRNSPSTSSNTPSGTNTPVATATPNIPTGYTPFSNSKFRISYPATWTHQTSSSSPTEEFISGQGQIFQVTTLDRAPSGSDVSFNSVFCKEVGNSSGGTHTPTSITIGGQQWQQLECGVGANNVQAVSESVIYKGTLYAISYASPSETFEADRTQFYSVMEQTFAFLG
jgi:hypothetical protein